MGMKRAADLPEARSRLLRYLEGHAADDWALTFGAGRLRIISDVVEENGVPTFESVGDGGKPTAAEFNIPQAFAVGTARDTAVAMARWQAEEIRDSDLHYVSGDMSDLCRAAAETLPDMRLTPDIPPHRRGLLAWATPPPEDPGGVIAASWCPMEGGLWVTLYRDTGPGVGDNQELLTRCGWLEEAGTHAMPWRMWMPTLDKARIGGPHAATRTLMATWLIMGQTITTHEPVEIDDKRVRRKIRHRGHPTTGVTYVQLRRAERDGPTDQGTGTGPKRYRGFRDVVTGHWRHFRSERYSEVVRNRPIWIDPYLKGDPNSPIRHPEKIYTLSR